MAKKKWITDRMPDDEETVEIRTPSMSIKRAWWKGVGWKYASGMWVDEPVTGWRKIA